MPPKSTWVCSFTVASALCAIAAVMTPSRAQAQGQPTSCTLRSAVDLFSKPKGQGRRTHLGAGATLEVLSHSGNWYTVYTGSAEAYLAASAFARACAPAARPAAPHSKAPTDLIDLPLEPLPTAPSAPANPPSTLPAMPEDTAPPPTLPTVAPTVVPEAAPPPIKRPELRRPDVQPPSSYFEPPAPIIDNRVSSRGPWVGLETGLWIGGGAAVVTSAVLYTVNAIRASDVRGEINDYNTDRGLSCSDPNQTTACSALMPTYDKVNSDISGVQTLNAWTIITGSVGVAALATALGLHFWGPEASDTSEGNPMSMPEIHVGWGSFVLESKF